MPARAKVFKNGSSQAVRLPKEFRFQGTEVLISKKGGYSTESGHPDHVMMAT